MTTPSRIYTVTDKTTGRARLVKAPNADRALRHVAHTTFSTRVASQDDLVAQVAAGTVVETAGVSPAPAPPVAADAPADDRTMPLDGVPLP